MNRLSVISLVFGLAGFLVALAARALGGFPNCASDERNWASIAEQVIKGVDWPISGPLHFWLVQTVSYSSGLTYPQTLSAIGSMSVPILFILILFAYEKLGLDGLSVKPIEAVLVLLTSSYFWSPMLESRPQQWGQILVFLGIIYGWLAINKLAAWWPYALLLVLTGLTHILSFAILAAGSLILWAILFVLRRVSFWQIGPLLIFIVVSLTVFILPNGPYSVMLNDITNNHLKFSANGSLVLLALSLIPVVLAIFRQHLVKLVGTLAIFFNRNPFELSIGGVLLVLGLLVFQAMILPAGSWAPYHGSAWFFVALQSGNLFFAGLSIYGMILALKFKRLAPEREHLEKMLILLIAMGFIAVSALVLSLWMLDTNWLLRVLNYSILLMAPFAAIGFSRIKKLWIKWGAWTAMSAVSLLAVVRPPSFFPC
jgi:hypothetical protein